MDTPHEPERPPFDADHPGRWEIPDYPDFGEPFRHRSPDGLGEDVGDEDDAIRPVEWNLLGPEHAEAEWHDLDRWVKFLKTTYGLPPSIVLPQ